MEGKRMKDQKDSCMHLQASSTLSQYELNYTVLVSRLKGQALESGFLSSNPSSSFC